MRNAAKRLPWSRARLDPSASSATPLLQSLLRHEVPSAERCGLRPPIDSSPKYAISGERTAADGITGLKEGDIRGWMCSLRQCGDAVRREQARELAESERSGRHDGGHAVIGRSRVPVLPGIRQDQNLGRGASSSVLSFSGVVCASEGAVRTGLSASERGSVAVPQVLPWEGFPPSFPIPHVEQVPNTPFPETCCACRSLRERNLSQMPVTHGAV